MNTLALVHYHNQVLTWSSDIEGSRVLSHQLIHLVDESRILHEKRDSLLYGIEAITKNHVTLKIFDEYGLAASGKEYIRFRAHYHMLPHPKINESYNSFETVTENVLNLVQLFKRLNHNIMNIQSPRVPIVIPKGERDYASSPFHFTY